MPMHQSIATIDKPEFINLQPLEINPMLASCEIKVLYVGENRNRTMITKDVATEMAKTLRGAPIVGYYKDSKEDFVEHSERITFDDEGLHFECLTKPYGFVSPDAKVWFKKFIEQNELGQDVIREYLMTTGYLWAGQYPECADVTKSGRPHSMELQEETLQGEWAEYGKGNIEFFIINDAIFSKLCILGNDVEPCFEGSSITRPTVSTAFTQDAFGHTLYTMMRELEYALKGGTQTMLENNAVQEPVVAAETPVAAPATDFANQGTPEQVASAETQNNIETSFKKNDEEEKKEAPKADENKEEGNAPAEDNKGEEKKEDDEEKKKEKKYSAASDGEDVAGKYAELEAKYSALQETCAQLLEFKANIEREEKKSLISEFYMLSDEDKADVVTNIDKYSLDDIEAKLSVICRHKKVNFSVENKGTEVKADEQSQSEPITTFNLDDGGSSVPAWVKAVKRTSEDATNI